MIDPFPLPDIRPLGYVLESPFNCMRDEVAAFRILSAAARAFVDVDRDGLNIDRARGDAVHREQGVGTAAGSLHLLPNLAQRTLPLGRALQEIEQV